MITPEIKTDISESSNEVIKSLALPATSQIGQALGNICGLLNTITLPVKLANNYAKRNFEIYDKKISNIKKENIRSVEPEIGIPIFEKLTYTSNEDLANAYANLLANASDKERIDCVHPGFTHKLNNMAPDEIKILEEIKEKNLVYYIQYKAVHPENSNFLQLSFKLTGFENSFKILPKIVDTHINNLISLNILKDNEGTFKVDDEGYQKLTDLYSKDLSRYQENAKKNEYKEYTKIEVIKSFYSITTLGQTFIEACTNK